MARDSLEVMNPIARTEVRTISPNARPEQLRGRIVGLLETRKPNADVFMNQIQERLESGAFGVKEIVRRAKPTAANEPTAQAIIAELSESCDLVIHGIAD